MLHLFYWNEQRNGSKNIYTITRHELRGDIGPKNRSEVQRFFNGQKSKKVKAPKMRTKLWKGKKAQNQG